MMDLLNDETDEEIELVNQQRRGRKSRRDAQSGYREYSGKLLSYFWRCAGRRNGRFFGRRAGARPSGLTPDGADEYVITEDKREIEQVVGRYVIESLLDEIGEVSEGRKPGPAAKTTGRGNFVIAGKTSICNNFLLPIRRKSCIIRRKGED